MSRSILIILTLFAVVTVCSCTKSAKTTTFSGSSLLIPWDLDTLSPPTSGVYINGCSQLSVNGIMVACKVSGSLTDTAGNTYLYTRGWEASLFKGGSPGTFLGGVANVSVNATSLNDTLYGGFTHNDTTVVWNDTLLNHWYVSGSDSVPTISEDIPGLMPTYTGTLPVTILRASNFSITFNSSNTINADSAFVILCSRNPSAMAQSDVVKTNGGIATISSPSLYELNNSPSFHLNWTTTGPIYSGGYIIIVIYNHTIQTIGGKQFAFVKQREYLGIVTFL